MTCTRIIKAVVECPLPYLDPKPVTTLSDCVVCTNFGGLSPEFNVCCNVSKPEEKGG
jgi:hypothetical protein